MSRIDVQTLVLAFEKRIDALEKNPPDKIATSVVVNLLERAIEDEIKNHFIFIVQKEINKRIKKEFEERHDQFITKCLDNIFSDTSFRNNFEKQIKLKMINSLEK